MISRRGKITYLASLLFFLSACVSTTPVSTALPVVTPASTPAPSPKAATLAPPTLKPGTFTNPVLDRDFPDPDILKVSDDYYVYATNANGINIQAARSTDLVHWDVLPDMLPTLPTWAV